MGWPQILVALWLTISIIAAAVSTVRPRRSWIVLTTDQQRIATFVFGIAAISEASLLIAGGFFKGMF